MRNIRLAHCYIPFYLMYKSEKEKKHPHLRVFFLSMAKRRWILTQRRSRRVRIPPSAVSGKCATYGLRIARYPIALIYIVAATQTIFRYDYHLIIEFSFFRYTIILHWLNYIHKKRREE